ncbi:hypothetical protein CB1_000249010 [Camelus ferus]|nr:hypothetical protein CB1_000249010 [Camelus ferus]
MDAAQQRFVCPLSGGARLSHTHSDLPRPEQGGRQHSGAELEPLTRSQQEPAAVQDKLLQVATREKGAAAKPCSASLPQAEGFEDQEKQAAGLEADEWPCDEESPPACPRALLFCTLPL